MENLEEMLEGMPDSETLFTKGDVEVVITKEEPEVDKELTKEEYAAKCKKEAMDKLSEFEDIENKKTIINGELAKAQEELEKKLNEVRIANKDLLDKMDELEKEFDVLDERQSKIKEDLLPLQQEIYLVNDKDKTLIYNKIQSTYVAATVKNQFDLKKFKEEQEEFWNNNLDILNPYAKFTDVSAYLKITVKD